MAGFNLPIQAIPPQLLAEMARAAFKPPALMGVSGLGGGGGGGGGGGLSVGGSAAPAGIDTQALAGLGQGIGGLGRELLKDKPPTVAELNEILSKGQKLAPSNASYGDLGGPGGTYESPGWFARNFGDMFSSPTATPTFGGGMADGGPVMPGQYYTVGERGPETFVPAVPGTIVPNRWPDDYPEFAPRVPSRDDPYYPRGRDEPYYPPAGREVGRDFFGGWKKTRR